MPHNAAVPARSFAQSVRHHPRFHAVVDAVAGQLLDALLAEQLLSALHLRYVSDVAALNKIVPDSWRGGYSCSGEEFIDY